MLVTVLLGDVITRGFIVYVYSYQPLVAMLLSRSVIVTVPSAYSFPDAAVVRIDFKCKLVCKLVCPLQHIGHRTTPIYKPMLSNGDHHDSFEQLQMQV